MSGRSLLISWQLKDKIVLIVGGGEIAAQRIDSILHTDAHITLVAPSDSLNSRTKQFVASHPDRVSYHDRLFSGVDELKNIDMVLTALDDPEESREIVDMCRTFRIPVNTADIPQLCDFYFGAQIRDGPLQIMISTNGKGPRMASLIRDRLQNGLTGIEGNAVQKVGELRELLKERAPGIGGEVGKKRMKWMTKLCNSWSLEELAMLDKETMSKLLDQGWEQNAVPTLQDVSDHAVPTLQDVSDHAVPTLQDVSDHAVPTLQDVSDRPRHDVGDRPRHDVDEARTENSFVFPKQVIFASVIGIVTGSLCTACMMAIRRR